MSIASEKQPNPTKNDNPESWKEVIKDYILSDEWYPEGTKDEIQFEVTQLMEERNNFGKEKYGTPLQAFNGRDSLSDALQEVLDAVVYLKNESIETNDEATTQLYFHALGFLDSIYIKYKMRNERRKMNEGL